MRILFISPRAPWPLDNAFCIRVQRFIHILSEIASVSLICIDDRPNAPPPELSAVCDSVEVIPRSPNRPPAHKGGWMLWNLLGRLPREARTLWSPQIVRRLRERRAESFDLCWLEASFTSLFLGITASPERTVVDLDDIHSVKAQRWLDVLPAGREWLWTWLDYQRILRTERELFRRARFVGVSTQADAEWLSRRTKAEVHLLPTGVDLDPSSLEMPREEHTMLFLGTMSYEPNADAALFFLREVFPLVRRSVPEARIIIVGKNPPPELVAFHGQEGIEVTGYVESVEPYLRKASLMVAPIRVGAGIRTKILQAMATGCPVISTTIGCEGIGAKHGAEIVVADGVSAFAAECVRLLRDPSARDAIAKRAYDFVSANYSWEAVEARVKALVDRVLRMRAIEMRTR